MSWKTIFALLGLTGLLLGACATPPPAAPPEAPRATAALPEADMARAREQRALIRENGLDAFSPDSFRRAEEAFAQAERLYGTDNEGAARLLATALPLYDETVRVGFGRRIDERRAAAEAARGRADQQRAAVAAAVPYRAGVAAMDRGRQTAEARRFRDSLAAYDEATRSFEESEKLAIERRAQAQEAMDRAAAAIDTTGRRMQTIDREMQTQPGGVR